MRAKIYTNKKVNYEYDNKKIRSGFLESSYLATEILLKPHTNAQLLKVEVYDYAVSKNELGEKIEVEIYRDLNYGTRKVSDLNGLEDVKSAIAYGLLMQQKATPIINTVANDWVSEDEFLTNILPTL